MSSEKWVGQLPTVPELDRAVVPTGGKVVRFVRVEVQPSHTRPVDLVQTEGNSTHSSTGVWISSSPWKHIEYRQSSTTYTNPNYSCPRTAEVKVLAGNTVLHNFYSFETCLVTYLG